MNAKIEEAIKKQARFEWEERGCPWGGTDKMTDCDSDNVAQDILENILDIDHTSEMVKDMDRRIRERFNKVCDKYDKFLEAIGPKM